MQDASDFLPYTPYPFYGMPSFPVYYNPYAINSIMQQPADCVSKSTLEESTKTNDVLTKNDVQEKPKASKRRKRSAFSKEQIASMTTAYSQRCYIDDEERQKLADELGLTTTAVKIWFQNQRQKDKKEGKPLNCDPPSRSKLAAAAASRKRSLESGTMPLAESKRGNEGTSQAFSDLRETSGKPYSPNNCAPPSPVLLPDVLHQAQEQIYPSVPFQWTPFTVPFHSL